MRRKTSEQVSVIKSVLVGTNGLYSFGGQYSFHLKVGRQERNFITIKCITLHNLTRLIFLSKMEYITHLYSISKKKRHQLNKHKSLILWFTGLSGSGKSTVAGKVEEKLYEMGFRTYILDGDNIRAGLNIDLGFDEKSRVENIRRIGEVSKLFVDAGIIVLTAFISPYISDRKTVRGLVGENEFVEIFVNCPLEECEKRDVKGLYKKVRNGEIKNFTGIDSPFEAPQNPDIEIRTNELSVEESVKRILNCLLPKIKTE